MSIERLRSELDIAIQWRAFPLHPDTPPDGLTLEDLFRNVPIDIPQMLGRLKQAADKEGLPFGERRMTFNSRLAQELGKWAERVGSGDRFHDAVFRAYFRDGRNIGQIETLADIGRASGLKAEAVQKVLIDRTCRSAVDRDWHQARSSGITAVPTFVFQGHRLVGAHPYPTLRQFLTTHGARLRR